MMRPTVALAAALLLGIGAGPAAARLAGGSHGGGGMHGGGHPVGPMGGRGGPGWHGGGWQGHGWHPGFGHHGGPRVFIGGFFGYPYLYGYDPYLYPWYPYAYPYPPPDEPDEGEPPVASAPPPEGEDQEAEAEQSPPSPEEAMQANYGLVQLRGVPDGAAVDLDGRFWLRAVRLDERWLALPRGEHTVTVHRDDRGQPLERHVEITPGRTLVVRF